LNNPWKILTTPFIRPEDIHHYEKLGVSEIKLTDRFNSTETLIKKTKAYLDRSYDGNLLDLLSFYLLTKESSFKKRKLYIPKDKVLGIIDIEKRLKLSSTPELYIDNKKLDGFLDFFIKNNIDCTDRLCDKCNWCKNFSENSIKFNNIMTWISLNINFSYWQLGIIFLILILFFCFIIFIIASYFIFKWVRFNISAHYFQINDFSKYQREILKKYGKCKIKKLYLVRNPIIQYLKTLINIITLYNFNKQIEHYKKKMNKHFFYPNHTSVICEIETEKGIKKLILIEKTTSFKISTQFKVTHHQELKQVKIDKNWTIEKILNMTKERMGDKKFFNWHVCENNCQIFVKEILNTLNLCSKKNQNFLMQDYFFSENIIYSDFVHHVINCSLNMYNILEMGLYSIL
jgi:hypothetical protein